MSEFDPVARRADLRWESLRAVLLALVIAVGWCAVYDRWTLASWQTPLEYLSDSSTTDVLSLFPAIKVAGEGRLNLVFANDIPELGAPFVANWDDLPGPEKPLYWATGLLSRFIGIFAAANVAVLLAQVLAAVSFYGASRLLNGAWWWALAGGVVFGFARFAFAHSEHHLTVLYYWHVPLCLVVCLWIFRNEGVEFGRSRFHLALAVAAITGVQNIYYTAMFVQLVLIGGFVQGWRRGWRASGPAAIIAATALGALLFMCANTILHGMLYGHNAEVVVRSYRWLEAYGLKLVDLVMPPPDHRFAPFAAWSAAHLKEIILTPGEIPPTGYQGLIGLAAMAWLVLHSLRRLLASGKLPLEAWLILWIILYSSVGGLNGILGVCGFQLIRTTTRYSIFILCLVLLFAVRELSRRDWRNRLLAYGAALLACVVAIWDQTPPFLSAADVQTTAEVVKSDRAFTEEMEQRLPAQAMVFQFPVMDFPESPLPGVGAYEHFRPYLFSHQLRFSFGSDKGRPNGVWQHALEKLPLPEIMTRLQSYGFAALFVNLSSMDNGGADFIKALAGLGYTDTFLSSRGDLLCVVLKPSLQPVLPASG